MKTTLLIYFSILISLPALAQSNDKATIINSGAYYYGEGISKDVNEAKDQALKELTEQIAVRVASSLVHKVSEHNYNLSETFEKIIKTHSKATLKNVKTIKTRLKKNRIEVFCYLKKSKVAEIFNERKKLIAEMVKEAGKYTEERNIAFALKRYYFAAILMNSIPDQNITYNDINYTTLIPQRINSIIMELKLDFKHDRYLNEREREITLNAKYKNKPVSLLDFTFWDGSNQVTVQARDGLATFDLLGPSVKFDKLQLSIRYSYYECRKEYKPVADLWELVDKPEFSCQKKVKLKKYKKKKPVTEERYKFDFSYDEKENPPLDSISRGIIKFFEAIKSGSCSGGSKYFSDDPFLARKICSYIKYNRPRPVETDIKAAIYKTDNGWEVRSLRMRHSYPSLNKNMTEYLVLDYSEEGKLIDLNISISKLLFETINTESTFGDDWGNRLEIIKFIEKYRTAYLTRDIKTVDLMFAEEALIIVGRLIKTKKIPSDMIKYEKLGNQPDVEYLRLTKEEYVSRLSTVFNYQEDIFLDFGTFRIIKKNNSPNVYGVEMRQSYFSTTYGDEGYLFLLIDFNTEDPMIYVRAWQPNAWNEDELIRTSNFRIYK